MIGETTQEKSLALSKTKVRVNQPLRGPRALYEGNNPQQVILWFIQENSSRGYRSQLAKAAGFHSSYLSQILRGTSHLSQEQALRLAKFWGLDENAISYFLDLVDLNRGAGKDLKAFLSARLAVRRQQFRDISNRIEASHSIPVENQYRFYSVWYYSAAYMLIEIDAYASSPNKIAARLGISLEQVSALLRSLEEIGLIEQREGRWTRLVKSMVLKDFPMKGVYLNGWRRQAMRSIELQRGTTHFTSIYTLSTADLERIKLIMEEAAEKSREVGLNSRGDDLYCINMDLFRV